MADLALGFLMPELGKDSEGIRGKAGANLNEKLKSYELKIKGPQEAAEADLESNRVGPRI